MKTQVHSLNVSGSNSAQNLSKQDIDPLMHSSRNAFALTESVVLHKLNKQKYMNAAGNSKQYLKSVQYAVQLDELVKVIKICAYDSVNEYQAVLLLIVDRNMQNHFNGKYLLQIWNDTKGMTYQKVLQSKNKEQITPIIDPLKSWNIFSDVLLFLLDDKEAEQVDEPPILHIVRFSDNALVKVKGLVLDNSCNACVYNNYWVDIHLGFRKFECLFAANETQTRVVYFPEGFEFNKDEPRTIRFEEEEVYKTSINSPLKIHGMFENRFSKSDSYIMLLIEMEDNQIAVQRLYHWDKSTFEYLSYREINVKPQSNDPVKKFQFVIDPDNYFFGVDIRESGKSSLYYNYGMFHTHDEQLYEDIRINFDSIFLTKKIADSQQLGKDGEPLKEIVRIDLKWHTRLNFTVGEIDGDFNEKRWKNLELKMISNNYKMFTSMTLIGDTFFVSCQNLLCIYDVFDEKWIQIISFEKNIKEVYRKRGNRYGTYFPVVLQENHELIILNPKEDGSEEWEKQVEGGTIKADGEVLKILSMTLDQDTQLLLIKVRDDKQALYYQEYERLTEVAGVPLTSQDKICKVTSDRQEDSDTRIAFIDSTYKKLTIYYSNIYHPTVYLYEFKKWEITNANSYDFPDQPLLVKLIDTDDSKMVIIFGQDKTLIYDENSKEVNVVNQKIESIHFYDEHHMYMLSTYTDDKNKIEKGSGMFYQKLDQILTTVNNIQPSIDFSSCFKIDSTIGGKATLYKNFLFEDRIAFQSSLETIKIIPLVHRNVLSFFGMDKKTEYYAFRRDRDLLTALSTKMVLTTWNMVTGKIVERHQVKKDLKLKEFSTKLLSDCGIDNTYSMGWYQHNVILINDSEEKTVDKKEFFQQRCNDGINGGRPFVQIEQQKFYEFIVIQIVSTKDVELVMTFTFPDYVSNKYRRMYLSEDRQYLLERLVNNKMLLYKRRDINIETKEVGWDLLTVCLNFSTQITENSYYNYLFSTDLQLYLDFDKANKVYLIKRTIDQKVHCVIPSGLMNPVDHDPVLYSQMFIWISATRFRIMNTEGFEKVLDVSDGKITAVGFGRRPMRDLVKFPAIDLNNKFHYYAEPRPTDMNDTFKMLLRTVQDYYSAYYVDGIRNEIELYNVLIKEDYEKKNYGKLVVNLSFTYLHWKMCELMQSQRNKDLANQFDITKLQIEDLKLLFLNIFPQGNTVLHHIYHKPELVKLLYEKLAKEEGFQIPFIQNFQGKSPLHLALHEKNYKSMNTFLEVLQSDEIDNHSRSIVGIIPDILQCELPSFSDYLLSRLKQTEFLKKLNEGALKLRIAMDYSVAAAEQWAITDQVKSDIFINQQDEQEVERSIKVQILDIPDLHFYQEISSQNFFKILSELEDITIFENQVIQALIDFKWPLARQFTIYMLFIPFVLNLAVFIVFSNIFNGQLSDYHSGYKSAKLAHIIILYILNAYFLINEVRQVVFQKVDYFKSLWNYVDIIPPILIIIIASFHLIELKEEDYDPSQLHPFISTLHSVASVLMWAKFLYFLRIFRHTGYLIRTLSTVIWDMKVFLLLLLIIYLGFGEGFLRLSEKSEDSAQFIDNYAYAIVYAFRLSIGDTDTDTFNDTVQPVTLWFMFVLCAVYTNIVMLNMLIAIISESFGKITSNSTAANYQERAGMIAENSYLIPWKIRKAFSDKNKYLIVAKLLKDEKSNEQQILEDKLSELQESLLKTMETKMERFKKESSDKYDEILKAIKANKQ